MYKRSALSEIFLRASTDDEIRQLVDLISRDPAVLEIWNFGSSARGEMRSGEAGYRDPSDIDFFVLVDKEDEAFAVHVRLLQEIGRNRILRPIDLVVWHREKWARAETHALGRAILRDGRKLYPT